MQPGTYLTNRVGIDEFDDTEFDDRFKVYRLVFSKWDERNSAVPELRKSVGGILAVKYASFAYGEANREMFILCAPGCSDEGLRDFVRGYDPEAKPPERIYGREMKAEHPDVLVELLCINAVSKPSENEGYSNIEGSLYLVDRMGGKHRDYVRTLNIRFRRASDNEGFPGIYVTVEGAGFSDVRMRSAMKIDNDKFAKLTRYTICRGRMDYLANAGDSEKNGIYVKHSFEGADRKKWPFFSMSTESKLEESKAGRLDEVLRKFNRTYDGMMRISLKATDRFVHDFSMPARGKKDLIGKLEEIKTHERFVLVDSCGDRDNFEWFLRMCRERNINIRKSRRITPGAMNIVVVLRKENDPEHHHYPDMAVQHISVEEIEPVRKAVEENERRGREEEGKNPGKKRRRKDPFASLIAMILINVVIKQDVLNHRMSFADWKDFFPNGRDWHFITRVLIPGKEKRKLVYGEMVDMHISAEGRCEYNVYHSLNEVPEDFAMIWSEFDIGKDEGESLIAAVSDGINSYGYYFKDNLWLAPSVTECSGYLQSLPVDSEGKTINKGKKSEAIRSLYAACLDVHATNWDNGNRYYSVGVPGKGINGLDFNIARIREIRTISAGEELPDNFLEMLTVPFVKYNMYTVVPFPFKYLKEFITMNGLDKSKRIRQSLITEF